MSRSGYSEDCDGWALICWRGAVAKSIRGKRGQAFLRETLTALDAMPDRKLAADSLRESATGEYCTLGAVGAARGMDLGPLEDVEASGVASAFGISRALAAEIMYLNDEGWYNTSTPEGRWSFMRSWVTSKIQPTP